jgi:protein-tyrosine phosphatase
MDLVGLWILFVCTGNVCRSPIAEFLLREAAEGADDLHLSSAGTSALVGNSMDDGSAAILSELGIDSSAHRARQFEPWMALGADLILTAELEHRDTVMTAVPDAFRRTFTMKEFARLVPHAGTGTPPEIIARAAQIRGIYGAVPRKLDEIPDPYRGGLAKAKVTAREILASLTPLVASFGLEPTEPLGRGPARRPSPRRHPA